jgi:hypothetical protein
VRVPINLCPVPVKRIRFLQLEPAPPSSSKLAQIASCSRLVVPSNAMAEAVLLCVGNAIHAKELVQIPRYMYFYKI